MLFSYLALSIVLGLAGLFVFKLKQKVTKPAQNKGVNHAQ